MRGVQHCQKTTLKNELPCLSTTKSRNTLSTRRIVIDCIDLSHLFVIGRSLLLTSMSSLIYCTWSVFVNVDDVNIFTIVLKEKW